MAPKKSGGNPAATSAKTILPSTMAELDALVSWCRARGVVQFALGELTLSLMPDEPPAVRVEEAVGSLTAPVVRGDDGLTREEQAEIYGAAMRDTEPSA
jgi:hypothetical protein